MNNGIEVSSKKNNSGLVKFLYVTAAVLALIFVYMLIVNIMYISSYSAAYGMALSDVWQEAVQYIVAGSVSYLVYAVLVFSAGKILSIVSAAPAAIAIEAAEEVPASEEERFDPERVINRLGKNETIDEKPDETIEENSEKEPVAEGEKIMKDYKKLQNGSDIRGIALTGVPGELPNLTVDEARDIARGFLIWLCRKTGKDVKDIKIAIGRDPRVSGKRLLDGLMEGFGPYGIKVYDCGLASTPAMFMATLFPEFKCDGGIMITASHLPYNRNGFKFFTEDGGLDKGDIKEILAMAEDDEAGKDVIGEPTNLDGYTHRHGQRIFAAEEADLMSLYCDHLKKLIIDGVQDGEKPLEGMKIVVDAGNGSGGFFARKVLAPLGADVSCSQFLDPDGTFPNHPPNPENKDAMHSVSMKTLSSGADFGLIFDTDVDRSAAVDGRGREIARNGIVAMAAALVAEEHPGTTIVTDSITSRQLTSFIEDKLGLKHLRFKRGYKNVINKSKELNEQGIDSQLAIETSGHAALKENYFLDDGAYLAVKIVIKAARLKKEGKTLDSVIADLEEPADEKEIRIPIVCSDFGPYGDKLLEDLEEFVKESPELSLEEPNYEGVRINFPDGWCLLRKSLHDPILPMNMAADKEGGCKAIKEVMAEFLSSYDQLDLSVMEK